MASHENLNLNEDLKGKQKVEDDNVQAMQDHPPEDQLCESVSSNYTEDDRFFDAVVNLIVTENLRFSFGEASSFVKLVKHVNPDAKLPISKRAVLRSMHEKYRIGRKSLIKFFKIYKGRVSLCIERWTEFAKRLEKNQERNGTYDELVSLWKGNYTEFISVTCRWIDEDWRIQKRILSFRTFCKNYSADNLCELIKDVVDEYRLNSKIFSISFDDAFVDSASVESLEEACKPCFGCKYFYVRNACQVLRLCVKEAMFCFNIHVGPIKQAASHLSGNVKISKEWGRFCKKNGARPMLFPWLFDVSWNSYYKLLLKSHPYSKLLSSFVATRVPGLTINDHNWEVSKKVADFLKVFYEAVVWWSRVYSPTSHLFFYQALDIADVMSKNEHDPVLSDAIKLMKSKWLSYFEDIPDFCLIACVLDPRLKLDGLREVLAAYYNFLGYDKNDDSGSCKKVKDVDAIVSSIRSQLDRLFDEYSISYGDRIPQFDETSLTYLQRHMLRRSRGVGECTELDFYLKTEFAYSDQQTGKEFLVLQWWKERQNQFPILNLIAKDVYAIPISTMDVNEAFIEDENILDYRRTNIGYTEIMEAQICLGDWMKADDRRQEIVLSNEDDEIYLTSDDEEEEDEEAEEDVDTSTEWSQR